MLKLEESGMKDNYKLVYFTFLFLGIAILLPWNSLIMALDYFHTRVPDRDINFVVSILSNVPLFFSNILMIVFSKYFPNIKTVTVTLFIIMVMTVALPVFSQYVASESLRWALIFLTIILISFINGVMQSCAYGLAGTLPGSYIATLSTGCALSGFIIAIARAFSLIVFPTDNSLENSNYFKGAVLYFSIGVLMLVIAIILIIMLPRLEYYDYLTTWTAKSTTSGSVNSDEEDDLALVQDNHFSDTSNSETTDESLDVRDASTLEKFLRIHKELILPGYGLILVYIQTFLVFPGVMLVGGLGFIHNVSWEVWLIISLYNLADTISRYASEYFTILNAKTALVTTIVRFASVGAFFLAAYDITFFRNDYVKIVNIVIIGFSNGYISNCQIIHAVKNAKDQDKEITSKFMVVFLVLGIALGSIASSFGISKLFD
ncbi:unnamed protein product [Moneuplotes crassus]|uniref:Nucleoside transporter n=1 Tax=Euplotes crassus TaxID=5936 RepID=A0AAD1XCP6_EUPCR|nr:unnamed protein product [Moneuplotes crassus]